MDLTPAAAVERIIAARFAPVVLSPMIEALVVAVRHEATGGEAAPAVVTGERWRLVEQLDQMQLQLRRYGRHEDTCPGAAGGHCGCGFQPALELSTRAALGVQAVAPDSAALAAAVLRWQQARECFLVAHREFIARTGMTRRCGAVEANTQLDAARRAVEEAEEALGSLRIVPAAAGVSSERVGTGSATPNDTDRLDAIARHGWAVLQTAHTERWQVELGTGDTVTRGELRDAIDASVEIERTGRGTDGDELTPIDEE